MIESSNVLFLSLILFAIASYGIFTRKNFLIIFFCLEAILSSVILNFLVFSEAKFIIIVWLLSIAETIIALALFLYLLKEEGVINSDFFNKLKW